jgi:capsular exopolysaccharide synthesis family protein
VTLLDFVRLTRANVWMILVLVLTGVGAAYVLTDRMPEVYRADASGYVRVAGQAESTGEGIAATTLSGSKAESYLPLVDSRAVAQRVIDETGIEASPAEVAGRVTASVATNSVILEVTATGPTPEEARVLADAVIAATAEEANRIETEGTDERDALVRIVPIESALPGVQVAPDLRRNLVVGGVVGLAVAYLIVVARRQLDTRLRTVDDVEDLTGSIVLGVVPAVRELRADTGRGRLDRLGAASESFRQLRTNLRFVGVDDPPHSIVVTSANAHEGKSTVSATLARVLADAGEHVVLIDADLRRPSLATVFDHDGRVGLSQLLAGQVGLRDILQDTDQEGLSLIPAGRTPPNPSELLGSVRMRQLVDHLARDHVVILDAPPLLPVTDAGVLTAQCDGALFVFAVGRTHKDQARLAARMMERVGGRVLGVVLNLAPRRGLGAVHYGYGHGGYVSDYATRRRYEQVVPEAPVPLVDDEDDQVPESLVERPAGTPGQ